MARFDRPQFIITEKRSFHHIGNIVHRIDPVVEQIINEINEEVAKLLPKSQKQIQLATVKSQRLKFVGRAGIDVGLKPILPGVPPTILRRFAAGFLKSPESLGRAINAMVVKISVPAAQTISAGAQLTAKITSSTGGKKILQIFRVSRLGRVTLLITTIGPLDVLLSLASAIWQTSKLNPETPPETVIAELAANFAVDLITLGGILAPKSFQETSQTRLSTVIEKAITKPLADIGSGVQEAFPRPQPKPTPAGSIHDFIAFAFGGGGFISGT